MEQIPCPETSPLWMDHEAYRDEYPLERMLREVDPVKWFTVMTWVSGPNVGGIIVESSTHNRLILGLDTTEYLDYM